MQLSRGGRVPTDMDKMLLHTAFTLMKVPNVNACTDVFTQPRGVYIIHCRWYHHEDWEDDHAEGIDHYVTYNAGTRLLQMYPEAMVLAQADVDDTPALLKALAAPPYQLRFHAKDGGRLCRRLALRVSHVDALATMALPSIKARLSRAAEKQRNRKRKRGC
jgi:hypothetical protein